MGRRDVGGASCACAGVGQLCDTIFAIVVLGANSLPEWDQDIQGVVDELDLEILREQLGRTVGVKSRQLRGEDALGT